LAAPDAAIRTQPVERQRKETRFSLTPILCGYRIFGALVIVFLSIAPCTTRAQGGPPLLTDDPGTPGNGNWELNIAYAAEKTHGERTTDLPRVDINYGLGPDLQLKYEVAWSFVDQNASATRGGLSNSLAGVKWRFLNEEQAGFNMSFYPQIEFNNLTRSLDRGLVGKGPNLLLPIEASKMLGAATVVGEIGRWFRRDTSDEWLCGVAISVPWSDSLELLAELHTTTDSSIRHADPVLNFGARKLLNRSFSLLASAGTGLGNSEDRTEWVVYFGLQLHIQ